MFDYLELEELLSIALRAYEVIRIFSKPLCMEQPPRFPNDEYPGTPMSARRVPRPDTPLPAIPSPTPAPPPTPSTPPIVAPVPVRPPLSAHIPDDYVSPEPTPTPSPENPNVDYYDQIFDSYDPFPDPLDDPFSNPSAHSHTYYRIPESAYYGGDGKPDASKLTTHYHPETHEPGAITPPTPTGSPTVDDILGFHLRTPPPMPPLEEDAQWGDRGRARSGSTDSASDASDATGASGTPSEELETVTDLEVLVEMLSLLIPLLIILYLIYYADDINENWLPPIDPNEEPVEEDPNSWMLNPPEYVPEKLERLEGESEADYQKRHAAWVEDGSPSKETIARREKRAKFRAEREAFLAQYEAEKKASIVFLILPLGAAALALAIRLLRRIRLARTK